MRKIAAALFVSALSCAAHASSVELQRGVSLHVQVGAIAQHEGYMPMWRLPVDEMADDAAHSYLHWIDTIYGTTKQLSRIAVAEASEADIAASVVCDNSKHSWSQPCVTRAVSSKQKAHATT